MNVILYMAMDGKLNNQPPAYFVGRTLLPLSDKVIAVPKDEALTVCLPPAGSSALQSVPRAFSSSFELLASDVAALLEKGDATVSRWIREHFGIVRFQASDVLPRAISSVAKAIFTGALNLTVLELAEAWQFIKTIVGGARGQAEDFWNDLGRFPLPLATTRGISLPSSDMVPAFLAYWPGRTSNRQRLFEWSCGTSEGRCEIHRTSSRWDRGRHP